MTNSNQKKQKLKEAKRQLQQQQQQSKQSKRINKNSFRLSKGVQRLKEINELTTKPKQIDKLLNEDYIPFTMASEFIPLLDVEKGIIKTTDGRFLKILQIGTVNYDLKSETEKRRIIREYQQYLRIAPPKFQIKCIAKQSPVRKLLNNIDINKAREEYSQALDLYEDEKEFIYNQAREESIARFFYMIIEYVPESRIMANDFNAARRQLEDAEQTARKYLGLCGNKVYDFSQSSSKGQLEMLYAILKRDISTEIPFDIYSEDFEDRWLNFKRKNAYVKEIQLREYISPQKMDFSNNKYVIIDGVYMSAIAIASNGYITKVPDTWISRFTTLGEGIDVDIYVQKEDRDLMKNKISKIGRIKKSQLNDAASKGSNEDKIDDVQSLVKSIQYIKRGLKDEQDFYWINTLIYITAKTEESWQYKVTQVKKILKTWEFKTNNLSNMQEDAYRSYLPFCSLDNKIFKSTRQNIITEGLVSIYPYTSYEINDDGGILLGLAENLSMVFADIFNTQKYSNANVSILGSSGGGKTYLMQLLATRFRMNHIPVCMIIPEKAFEYARLCEKLGGEFISISPASQHNINIMEIREKDSDSNKYIDGRIIESSLLVEKVQSLLVFFSLVIPDMTHEEKQMLDDAIVNTYHDFKIFQNNESIYVKDENGNKIVDSDTGKYKIKEMPILQDLYNRMEKTEGCKRMATIIRRFVYGSARNFNQPTNVNLDNEFTVIDLSNLTDDMLLLGMWIALDFASSKAKENRTTKKAIFIDEMWKLLGANRLTASYVLNLYKTIRGYGGAVIGSTQELVDLRALDNGKYGKGIINNSQIKFILKTQPEEIKEVKETLGLSEDEANTIMTLNHQAMLIANNNNLVINIKASPMEHKYFTTDRNELAEISKQNKQRAINTY